MSDVLRQYREQYPQYSGIDDDTLAEALRVKFYSDLDPDDYRQRIGMTPKTEVPTPEPTVWDRVKEKSEQERRKPNNILTGAPDDLSDFTDEPDYSTLSDPTVYPEKTQEQERKEPAPKTGLLDQILAGWDEYRANRATKKAFGQLEDYRDADDIAYGRKDSSKVGGGFLGVSGEMISKYGRAQRAQSDDPAEAAAAQKEIDEEIIGRRAELVSLFQRSINESQERRARAAEVEFSRETQEFVSATGFGQGAREFLDDPVTILGQITARSLPNMAEAVPLMVVGGLTAGPVGLAAGAGYGAANVEYNSSLSQYLQKAGVDLTNAESIVEAAENDELMNAAHVFAMKRSAIIGTVSAASGGISSQTLAPFVKNAVGKQLANIAAQTVAQSTLEGTGEALAQLATEGRIQPGEVLAEAVGGLVEAPIEVGVASISGVRSQVQKSRAARVQSEVNEILGRGNAAEVSGDAGVSYSDQRLVKKAHRDELQNMADSLATSETVVRDEFGDVIEQRPPVEPEWMRSIQADPGTKISTRDAQKAVEKATTGKPLGVREQRAVQVMADHASQSRLEGVDLAQEQLDGARQKRAQSADALDFDIDVDIAGELFSESEYSPTATADARIAQEAMEQASTIGILEERISNIAQKAKSVDDFIAQLDRVINEQRSQRGVQDVQAQPAARPEARPEGERRGGQRRRDVSGEEASALGRRDTPEGRRADAQQVEGNLLTAALPERRTQIRDRRRAIEQMTTEEIENELYKDQLTGLGNRKAFNEEHETYPWIASVDADSLKWINDNLSPDAGDAMLTALGQALDQEGVAAWHISGDEYYVAGETQEEIQAAMELAAGILKNQVIKSPKGVKTGVEFTYGMGRDKLSADTELKAEKVRREERGERAGRGMEPPGVKLSSKPKDVLNMDEGTNFAPIIGLEGSLPIDAEQNFVLGNGRTVRIPKVPVRREHILSRLQETFGLKIYRGRVKGARTRLGFFRRGHGEVRLRNANDLEVAAHEVAHWLDDRNSWIGKLHQRFEAELGENTTEGYAEFMRTFLTDEPTAMRKAPSFYDTFRAEMKKRPEFEAAVYDMQEMMHAWHLQGARARLASKVDNTRQTFFDRTRRAMSSDVSFLQRGLDGLRAIKTAELDVTNKQTREAYEKMRLAVGGSNGVLEAAVYFGTPGWRKDGKGLTFTGDSIHDVFGDQWENPELALYLVARRAQELKEQGRENLLRDDEIQAGLEIGRKNPDFARIHDRYQEWNGRMLDFAEQSGLISPETRVSMQEMNQSYIPFNRVIESMTEGTPVKGGGNPFRRLKGGTANISNVWDSIINNTGYLIRASMMNDAKKTLYGKIVGATNQRGALYAAPIAPDTKAVSIPSKDVIRKLAEAMGISQQEYVMAKEGMAETDEHAAIADMIDRARPGLEEMVTFFQNGVDPTGHVDYYLDNGKKQWFEISDPGLWDSIKFLGPKPMNLVLNMFGFASTLLRRGVVGVPVFQIKNFIRDTANSWLLSSHIKVPAVRAMGVVMSKMSADPAYREMMLNGGGFANRIQGLRQHRSKVVISPRDMAAQYDRFMGRFENANRLAEYKAARARGESPRRAALLSRDISTDFAMRGSSNVVRALSVAVPFMNARAQGLYRLGQQFTTADAARSYAMRGALLTTATAALYAINKDDERYKEMPEDVKDLYWVFFTGTGEDEFFLVPKPFESGMLWGTMAERIMELTEKRDGKEFADALGWMFVETFAADPTPQAFVPLAESIANKKFTGAPIIPHYLENVEPSQQFTYYTGETAKAAGEALGASPIKMEHYFRGYLGTLGTWMLAGSDALIRATVQLETGEMPTRGETWKENVLVKAVIDPLVREGPPRRTKYLNDFYEMAKETEKVANTVALMQKRHSDDVQAYLEDPKNQFLFGANPAIQKAKTALSGIRTTIDAIRTDAKLSGDDKRVQIWELVRRRNKMLQDVMPELQELQRESR